MAYSTSSSTMNQTFEEFKHRANVLLNSLSKDPTEIELEEFNSIVRSFIPSGNTIDSDQCHFFCSNIIIKAIKEILTHQYNPSLIDIAYSTLSTTILLIIHNIETDRPEISELLNNYLFNEMMPFYLHYGRNKRVTADVEKFRRELQTGQFLDFNFSFGRWVIGIILDIKDDELKIEYSNPTTGEISHKTVSRSSDTISPQQPTSSEQWRSEIVKDAHIDCLDTVNKWYTAEIVEVKGDMVLVSYDGWTNKFDEWIPRTSDRLAPLRTYALGGRESGGIEQFQTRMIADADDPDGTFAVFRGPEWGSYYYVDLINCFGENNGFTKLLSRIQNHDPNIPIVLLVAFISALSKCVNALSRPFLKNWADSFTNSVFDSLMNLNDVELRRLTKESLLDIIHGIEKLLNRIYSRKEVTEKIERFSLDIALKRFRCPIVERRINALSFIQEMCNNIRRSPVFAGITYWMSSSEMVTWLKDNKILEEIFDPVNGHVEMMRRSSDLLKFIASENALSNIYFDMIWSAMNYAMKMKEDDKLTVLYDILNDLSWIYTTEHVEYLFVKINTIPPSQYVTSTINLIKELSKLSNKCGAEVSTNALSLLWNIMQDDPDIDPSVASYSCSKLEEILTQFTLRAERAKYIELCISNIKNNTSVPLSLSLFRQILEIYPTTASSIDESRSTIIERYNTAYDIIDILLNNLKVFKDIAIEKIKKIPFSGANASIICSNTSFIDHILNRILFLHYILTSSNLQLNLNSFLLLWDLLYVNAITGEEQLHCFNFITMTSSRFTRCYDLDVAKSIFDTFVKIDLSTLPPEGYACFQSLFLYINAALDNIHFVANDPTQSEFIVKSFNMIGNDILWRIVTSVLHPTVFRDSVAFLNKIHERLSPELQKNIHKVREDYISRCMQFLHHLIKLHNLENVQRCLSLIINLLDSSEKKGIAGFRSHGTQVRGSPIEIVVSNNVLRSNKPKSFKVTVHENDTIWDLRSTISKVVDVVTDYLCLVYNGRELYFEDNARTLFSMKVSDHSHVLCKKNVASKLRVELVRSVATGNKKKLVPRALLAFYKIFAEFASTIEDDVPEREKMPRYRETVTHVAFGPMAANEPISDSKSNEIPINTQDDEECLRQIGSDLPKGKVRVMYPKDMKTYIIACGAGASSASHDRVMFIFNQFGDGIKEKLYFEGFAQFYEDAVEDRPIEVWNDLTVHGFRYDLRKEAEVAQEEAKCLVDSKSLPRCILSSNNEYYKLFFSSLPLSSSIADTVWGLLMRIPTDPELYSNLISLKRGVKDWNDIIDSSNPYKLLYSLQIVESLIQPIDDNEEKKESLMDRQNWRESFINAGGFDHLYSILTSLTSTNSWVEKSAIALLLKIMNIFVMGAISVSDEMVERVALMRTDSEERKVYEISLSEEYTEEGKEDGVDTSASEVKKEKKENEELEKEKEEYSKENDFRKIEKEEYSKGNDFTKLVRSTSAGSTRVITDRINVNELFQKLVELISTVASGKASFEDSKIVEYSCFMIISLFLYKPHLIQMFYTLIEKDNSLFFNTLHSLNDNVRREFSFMIARLSNMIPSPETVSVIPHEYFLKLLLSSLGVISSSESKTQCLEEHFHLLCKLLRRKLLSTQDHEEYEVLVTDLIDRLKNWHSREYHDTDPLDQIMIGMLKLLIILVRSDVGFRELVGSRLIDEIFHRYLFSTGLESENLGKNLPKAKTATSRIVCYNLLIALCINSPKNLSLVISLIMKQHQNITKLTVWDYNPEKDLRSSAGYVGLKNQGATCYMNSLLQQFYMMPSFRYSILQIEDREEDKSESLLYQLQNMFGYLCFSMKQSYDTLTFCHSYKDETGAPINVRIQQDAQEFFNVLLDRLENTTKGSPNQNFLKKILIGLGKCGSVRETPENFYCVSLEVKNRKSLYESLDQYVMGEKISHFNCSSCRRKTDVNKRVCLEELNDIIVFHLKRFELQFHNDVFVHEKVNDHFEFPLEINLQPYTKEGLMRKEILKEKKEKKDEKDDNKDDNDNKEKDDTPLELPPLHDDDYYQYELVGITVHMGTAQGGHYYSFIKQRAEDTQGDEKNQWLEFNDSIVRPFSLDFLAEECYGDETPSNDNHMLQWPFNETVNQPEKMKNAYMLFYQRKSSFRSSHKDIPKSPKEEKEEENIVDGATAVAKMKQMVAQQEKPDSHTDSQVLPFEQIVPGKIMRDIQMDNMIFMRDRQLFNHFYFKFVFNVFSQSSPNESVMEETSLKTILLGTQFAFDVLARCGENKLFTDFISLLKRLYPTNEAACSVFLKRLIENKSMIPEYALVCRSNAVREGFCDLVMIVIQVVSKTESYASLVITLLDIWLEHLDVSKRHWLRFDSYFKLLYDFATISFEHRKALASRSLIVSLINYIMDHDAPWSDSAKRYSQMGAVISQPHFENLLNTVSILILASSTNSTDKYGRTPYSMDGAILTISEADKKKILTKEFYVSTLKMDSRYATPISQIMCHWAWNWDRYTKSVAEVINEGIQHASADMVKPYFDCFEQYVQISDSLQSSRFELLCSGRSVLYWMSFYRQSSPRFTYSCIKHLLPVIAVCEPFAQYMISIRSEWVWMDRFHHFIIIITHSSTSWLQNYINNKIYVPPPLSRQESRLETLQAFKSQVEKYGGQLHLESSSPMISPNDFEPHIHPEGGEIPEMDPNKRTISENSNDHIGRAGNYYEDPRTRIEEIPFENLQLQPSQSASSSLSDEWECHACTYVNHGPSRLYFSVNYVTLC